MTEDTDLTTKPASSKSRFYYSEIVRKIFLTAGVIVLVTMPFLYNKFSPSIFFPIAAVIILTLAAGITTKRQQENIIIDLIISLAGLIVYSFRTVTEFEHALDLMFVTNILLSCAFLFATYLSVKIWRGEIAYISPVKKEETEETASVLPDITDTDTSEAKEDKKEGLLNEEERRKKRFLNQES